MIKLSESEPSYIHHVAWEKEQSLFFHVLRSVLVWMRSQRGGSGAAEGDNPFTFRGGIDLTPLY